MNQKSIKRALVAQNKAYHKELQHVQFTYKIEMARGWDYLSIPTRVGTKGTSHARTSIQEGTGDMVACLARDTAGLESIPSQGTSSASMQHRPGPEASTLRQALLGTAAVSDGFARFGCRREKAIGPALGSGVYCTQQDQAGGTRVEEIGKTFVQSENLQTTARLEDQGGATSVGQISPLRPSL